MKFKLSLSLLLTICFSTTLQAQQTTDFDKGHEVYDTWCGHCHAPGRKHPGTQALDALYKGEKPGVIEERTDLTPEMIKAFVRNGVSIMAPFRKTEISDAELDDLSVYLTTQPK